MRWGNFLQHYYRYRQSYCRYRQCVQRHYTKARFTHKANLCVCSPKQLGKGFRVYFLSPSERLTFQNYPAGNLYKR